MGACDDIVRGFLLIFINNKFVDSVSGKTFVVINPSVGRGEELCVRGDKPIGGER